MKQLIGIPLFLLLLQLLGSSKIWSSRGIATLSAPLVAVAFVAILDPTTATNSATAGKIDTNSNNYREGIPHSRRGQSRNSNSKSSPVDNRHLDEDFLQRQAEMELIRNSWEYQLKKIRRAVYLLVLFAPVLFTAGFAYLSVFFRNYIWFSLLSKTIGYSGAAFIKWGQWSSTRPDMFPPELCRKLSDLQANAPMHSYSLSKSMIENELGMPINEAFDQFEKTPIASGSIAQIHRGVYLGQTVAVKVRHPNVEEQIMIDFDLMNAVVRIIESLPGLDWLNLSESMAQFSHTIAGQVRLDIEGKHLAMFNTNFRNWDDIYFPRPILLTESVLIESFIEGERVSDTVETLHSRAIDHELDYSHFAVTRGEDLYLKMLLQDNLMHADLHPGNIIINGVSFPGAPEPTELSARNRNRDIPIYTLTLVDAGMVATLTSEEQTNFIGLLEAMGEGRGDEAADYVLNFSSNPPKANKAFKEDMIKLFQQICKGYGTNTGVGIVLRGILNLVRIHKVTIESNYATLVMNALCLDGLSSMLLPAYNVLDGAKSLLRLNRFSRKLPRFLAKPMMKAALPIVQVVKRFEDRKFLKRLKDELQTKYTLHAVHQTSRDVQ